MRKIPMIDLESIPAALKEGENWQLLDLDPDWLWIEYAEDRPVGILLAGPMHGLAFLWRIKTLPSSPPTTLLRLLRRFIKDIRARGCLGYIVALDLARPEEMALARIAIKAKGMFAPKCVTFLAGTTETGHLGEVPCQL